MGQRGARAGAGEAEAADLLDGQTPPKRGSRELEGGRAQQPEAEAAGTCWRANPHPPSQTKTPREPSTPLKEERGGGRAQELEAQATERMEGPADGGAGGGGGADGGAGVAGGARRSWRRRRRS